MDETTRPHADRAALLTIDVQNDFSLPGAVAEIEGTMDAVPRIAAVCSAFRAADAPIVHVVRLYRADGSNVDRCRRTAVAEGQSVVEPGTAGAELVDELDPRDEGVLDAEALLAGEFQALAPKEWAMYKPRWGAFYETGLADFLRERGVDTLVVCGCNFPNCPRTTVYEASERDFRMVFVADATSGTDERGLEELANIGVEVVDADETVRWLETGAIGD